MDAQAVTWENWLDYASLSDLGMRRTNNQDCVATVKAANEGAWQRRGDLLMVADGMGAHAAGELASRIAADTVPHTYYKYVNEAPVQTLRRAIEDANGQIHARGQANLDFRGMGTTASVLLLHPSGALIAHVGDSRVYRLRGNRLEQLTFDHSLVWEMMATGRIRDDEIPSYIPRNIITRSLGPNEQVQIDLEGPYPLLAGDTFLVCSDGLTGQVSDDEIGAILSTLPPGEAVHVLVDLANLRGGPDNISVVVARVRSLPQQVELVPLFSPVGGTPRRPKSQPLAIAACGALAIAAVALFAANLEVAGFAAGMTAGILGVTLLLRRLGFGISGTLPPEGTQLGSGPHRSTVCNVDNSFVDRLSGVTDQLQEAATDNRWSIQWPRFASLRDSARAAAAQKNYAEAARSYCRAISFMMEELRRQKSA